MTNPAATDRPSLVFVEPASGEEVTLAFGFYRNEATMAMFHGDSLVLIPREVLMAALLDGWSDDGCPHCPVITPEGT